MTKRHICRAVRIGVAVEAAAVVGAVYGGLWLLGWAAERLPAWLVPVGILAVPVLGVAGIWWDSKRAVELKEGTTK